MQWSFSSKVSARPQVLSFQEKEMKKTGFDSLASAGLVTITTTDVMDSNINPYSSFMQKNVVSEKQGRYTMTTYPTRHLKAHTITLPMSSPVHQSFASTISSGTSVVGTTESTRNTSTTSSTMPSQLTIFYSGSVCVYDNVSPEKAQAIMLLAGNGPTKTASPTVPTTPLQPSIPTAPLRPSMTRSYSSNDFISRPYASSHLSVTPVSRAGTRNNVMIVKPIRSVPPTILLSDAVPQARRKSLARFLEKRKLRVVNTSPYPSKESPDCNRGSGSTSLSVTSSGSCPLPATN